MNGYINHLYLKSCTLLSSWLIASAIIEASGHNLLKKCIDWQTDADYIYMYIILFVWSWIHYQGECCTKLFVCFCAMHACMSPQNLSLCAEFQKNVLCLLCQSSNKKLRALFVRKQITVTRQTLFYYSIEWMVWIHFCCWRTFGLSTIALFSVGYTDRCRPTNYIDLQCYSISMLKIIRHNIVLHVWRVCCLCYACSSYH